MTGAEGKYLGVRVGVTNGGCAGMSYTMNYAEDHQSAGRGDRGSGHRIFIEPKAILFLIGTEMDFETTKLGSRFVFKNPNQTAACGCGESVSITPGRRALMPGDPDRFDDLFAPFGKIVVRRMFGAEGLFRDGLMFGIVYRRTDLSQNQ